MDFGLVFGATLSGLFVGLALADLWFAAGIARHQRDQEGWADDVGWMVFGALIAVFFIVTLWIDNDWVFFIAFATLFATRRPRRAAADRYHVARQQRLLDKALTEAARDAETGEPVEAPESHSQTRHEQETR
jgi:hypothetical protein